MKIKAILAALGLVTGLGFATEASADHERMRFNRWNEPTTQSYCRENSSVVIATGHIARGGYRQGVESFALEPLRGIDWLRLKWVDGTTTVSRVAVTFANGRTRVFDVGNALTPNPANQVTTAIPIRGRAITRIDVHGSSVQPHARFEIVGSC